MVAYVIKKKFRFRASGMLNIMTMVISIACLSVRGRLLAMDELPATKRSMIPLKNAASLTCGGNLEVLAEEILEVYAKYKRIKPTFYGLDTVM